MFDDLWQLPEMSPVLADHDIAEVFRRLQQAGYSQPQIAHLTNQSLILSPGALPVR